MGKHVRQVPTHADGHPTELEAAQAVSHIAQSLADLAIEAIRLNGPSTPEEIKVYIDAKRGPTLLNSIRPRLSALKALGLVEPSGQFGLGEGGRVRAIRWQLVRTASQRDLFRQGAR